MPTVDLSTARVGSEVTTHAGAKLVISSVERKEHSRRFAVMFNGYPEETWNYMFDGLLDDRGRQRVMDIIAISPPPMSDAERLVESEARFKAIAKTARDMLEIHGFGYDYNGKLESIIGLAGKD